MVLALKVEITNTDVLDRYGKLLAAQTKSRGAESGKSITSELEQVISKTLFRGVTATHSNTGISPPDWIVSNTGMVSLMKTLLGDQIIQGQKFADYISHGQGADTIGIEGKFLRSESTGASKEVKIGDLVLLGKENTNINFFDFTTNSVIDTTRFNLVDALRNTFSPEDTKATTEKTKPLTTKIDKSKLGQFFRTLSPDFQKFLAKDESYAALYRLLSSPSNPNSENTIQKLVNNINDRWVKGSFENELRNLSQSGKLFDYITKVPELRNQFYSKSRLLSIFRIAEGNSKANALILGFKQSDFTSKYFGARLDGSAIRVFLKSDVEKTFLEQLSFLAPTLQMGNSMEEFDRSVKNLIAGGSEIKSFFNGSISYVVPTGGSIPMSRANLNFSIIKNTIPTTFIKTGKEELPKQTQKQETFGMGTFLSTEYLRLLVIKRVVEKMPHGEPNGLPRPVPGILTYRTGRFANSIDLLVNYKTQMVRYYYNPIYYVHESTSRDPRALIRSSVEEILASRFKQKFQISEVYRF